MYKEGRYKKGGFLVGWTQYTGISGSVTLSAQWLWFH